MPVVENIIVAVLYLIPGFLAREIYHSRYPLKARGDLIITLWSILYSVIIYAIVRFLDFKFFNNYLESSDVSLSSYKFIFSLFGAAIFFGLAALGYGSFRYWISTKSEFITPPNVQSAWGDTMARVSKQELWSIVFLHDESIYAGWIKKYTYDPDSEYQDFLLQRAIRVQFKGNKFIKLYEVQGIGVHINTKEVRRIEFVRGSTKRK